MLDSNNIDRYLNFIFTGEKLTFINVNDVLIDIKFKYPNNNLKQRADLLYDKIYKSALVDGLLPIKELEKFIINSGYYTEKDDADILRLESKLKAQEILLSKTTKVKANSDRIKGVINKIKTDINKIKNKKSSKLFLSADMRAEEDKTAYLCWGCTYREDDILFWQSYENLLKETNLILKDKILNEFLKFINGIESNIIRHIARSNIWRIRYISSQKTSDQLFGIPASEYTMDMLHLIYWSNYYQNIYEMMPEDRPTDGIIEDDEALDAFMNSYYDERKKSDSARRAKNSVKGTMSAFDKQEVIVTQSNELYHDIEYDKPKEALKAKYKDRTDLKTKETSDRLKK